ncbi:hypothetical protein, partial [Saccharothrix deserti]|uniref:hypothetical protein n=1 Tax=Saccharothrix deserti TaxID=2593674 RepID=UPI003B75B69D
VPAPATTRAPPVTGHGLQQATPTGLASVSGDAFADTDGAIAGSVMQGGAGAVLGEEHGLGGNDLPTPRPRKPSPT